MTAAPVALDVEGAAEDSGGVDPGGVDPGGVHPGGAEAGVSEVGAVDVAALAETLRARQRPVKTRYREDPGTAVTPTEAVAVVDQSALTSTVPTWAGDLVAGLHPAAGGDGSQACSADILLQALVACAGVTLSAVATASGLELRRAEVRARSTWDARGTLAVDREARVGLGDIDLVLDLDVLTSDGEPASEEQVARLVELTERYCVVARTLTDPPEVRVSRA